MRNARVASLNTFDDTEARGYVRQPESDSAPGSMTALRSVVTERHWRPFKAFRVQFLKAARELAEREGDPEFGRLDVSERQFQRWLDGGQPRPYSCRVLEHLFGLTIEELMAPDVAADAPGEEGATGSAFAVRLKDLRLRCGYSLRRLERLVHYSHGYLWDLENGQKPPTAAVASALDRALGADGGLSALVADLDAGNAASDDRVGVLSGAEAARSGGPLAPGGPASVQVHVGAGAEVTVVCHDGEPGRVAVLAGSVRVLIDASGSDVATQAPAVIDAPMVVGGARVYSLAERRAR